MTSFNYRLYPLYTIKECSSCGTLYTTNYCCSEGSLRDKIICDLNKTPDLFQQPPQNCPKCGNPVDGQYCQGCALLRKKFKEDLFTYCIENGIFQDFQDTSKPTNNNTNVVNALQETFVVKQDPSENSSQSPLYINHHCYYGYGDSSEDIFAINVLVSFMGKVLSLAWETILEIEHALEDKHCQPKDRPTICYNDDDDEDRTIAITPILSTKEPDNSLSIGDEHLDTILITKPDTLIKSSVENLVPIQRESDGIPDNMCDVPFHENSLPLDISKDQFEDFFDSKDDSTSIDDDSFSIDNIEYVEASPPDSELVSLEVMEIVIPKVGGIDVDILLTIKDDILREKLLNINLPIANIKALKDNPTLYFDFMTKSSSTSLNFLLEETNTFDNSLPESETFCFDSKENSSGSTNTHSDISLPDYEAFYDNLVKEISSEFIDELAHIISSLEYDCFCFKNEPNLGDFTMDVVEDTFPTREPRVHVHNVLPTHPTLQLNLDFILSSESVFAYVVWIFFPFLSYSVAPQYLLSFRNEDTIFDPDISICHSFVPDVSHRSGTFIKINVHPKHLNGSPMEILFSICSLMD
nr:hypothetical protein [Tanacetum cinerariifolium]